MKDVSEQDLAGNLRLVARKGDARTVVRVGDVEFGSGAFSVIAGPCTVESREQVHDIARAVKASGASMLRGGAFKPLTFPYRSTTVFELGLDGLRFLREAGDEVGLPIVSEITDVRMVDDMAALCDMLQIGARNMQNFLLLAEVAKTRKPVLLKRHFGASLRDAEWHRGAGAGLFVIAPLLKINLAVAHGLDGGGTRLTLGTGFSF